jgi:REP element-mobilizing transposase RayT
MVGHYGSIAFLEEVSQIKGRIIAMSVPSPIYITENCRAAYQLNWSLAIFWHEPINEAPWVADLQTAVEPDGVRLLEHRFMKPGVSQFLLSTRPEVSPERLVWSVKGRLQHRIQQERPKAFRRNYGLRSLGSAARDVVENYVQAQIEHHPMADPRVQRMLQEIQIRNPEVDLSKPCQNTHALYWYNLHVCFVNDGRCREICGETFQRMRTMILRAAGKKGHRLSFGGILTDHIHLTLGCQTKESPAEVALSYMNNLAYACGSK